MTNPITIPGTEGIPEIPTISIYGGHKGRLGIILEDNFKKEQYVNYNCDCVGQIKELLDEMYFIEAEKRGFNLKQAIIDVVSYIWVNSTHAYGKCYACLGGYRNSENEEHGFCYDCSIEDWELTTENSYNPDSISKKFYLNSYISPTYLKDFDFRLDAGIICLKCRIKKISSPKLNDNRHYIQDVILYDDDTNKTLKGFFNDKCADYDKWKKGDKIIVLGQYRPYSKNQISVSFVKKITDTSEDSFISDSRFSRTPGYDHWRKSVLSRDGQKCVCCGYDDKEKYLHAHHLFGYEEHLDLGVTVGNGVTLCKFCHDKYHSIYGKKDINPADFVDFINKFGRMKQ